jgi:hypothetical protein
VTGDGLELDAELLDVEPLDVEPLELPLSTPLVEGSSELVDELPELVDEPLELVVVTELLPVALPADAASAGSLPSTICT